MRKICADWLGRLARRTSIAAVLRLPVLAFAATLLALASPAALPAETLRSMLAKSLAPPGAPSLPNLDREIANYSVLDNGQWFVIAYYLQGSSAALEGPLRVDRYDRARGQWRTATFSEGQIRAGDGDCQGSAAELAASPDGFLLATHLTPSAQCLLVLSTELEIRTILYGWPLAQWSDGSIVYHRSQIHFAPVHAAEVAFYNRKTGRSYLLYPRKPFQAVRLGEITKLTEFFDAHNEWCNRHNHPCDPEWFDNALDSQVVFNEQSDALAFVIDYGSDPEDPGAPPVTAGHRKVVYVYRQVRNEFFVEYREMLQQDVAARFGAIGLADLLTPARLKQIFGK